MKPTQQEIIELAREAGITTINNGYHPVSAFTAEQLERLVHLALERFGAGAGGGEPIGYVRPEVIDLLGRGVRCGGVWLSPRADEEDGLTAPLYTHPSPTDLRDAYYEGFMASGEGWNGEYPFQAGKEDPRLDRCWCQTRDAAIEALKGKK